MQGSQKSEMQSEELFGTPVTDLDVVEPSVAVDEIVEHVTKMVHVYGNGEPFEPREWVNQWLDRYVPALGDKPRSFLDTREGRERVKNVLDMSWSGAYA